MKKLLSFILFVMLIVNCTSVSEDDLIDTTPIEDVITYNNQVKPIIDNNCIHCHSMPPVNGAPMPLIGYGDVKNAVLNDDLIERISSEDLGFLMPFGGPRLPQNLIDIIIQWEIDGLLED